MRRILALFAVLLISVTVASAQSLTDADRTMFRDIITGQIEAFRVDDGPRAYSFAAPVIRQVYPNPDVFMNMVRRGYQPVYRPQSFRFGAAGYSASGRPTQRLTVVGPDGLSYEAIYTMEQQSDGTWQISGCAIVRAPDIGA